MARADDEHSIFNPKHRQIYQDMSQPLCHYFIASSHNTYLTKDQIKSKSSVDAYISAFKRGCKCVELDTWDGPDNEPIIYHGHTLTSKILFKDVIVAIRDYAFHVNRYPVILSFENHCSVEQQKVMAMHLRNILGNLLHLQPVTEDVNRMPSPEELKGYILVKAKKKSTADSAAEAFEIDDDYSEEDEEEFDKYIAKHSKKEDEQDEHDGDAVSMASEDFDIDPDDKDDDDSGNSVRRRRRLRDLVSSGKSREIFRKQKSEKKKVPKVSQELSDLVTYCQAVGFESFAESLEKGRCNQMSSFGERKALKFLEDDQHGFLRYNVRKLSRIYPAGARIDSSNYDPMQFWAVGCQLVALNYQTPCFEMQLNQGLFQNNGGCGYVLKPEFMRREPLTYNPQGPFIERYELNIKGLRGHKIEFKQPRLQRAIVSLFVEVRVHGIDADCAKSRTSLLKLDGGSSPIWDKDVLSFKIRVPELALVQFAVHIHLTLERLRQPRFQGPVRRAIREMVQNARGLDPTVTDGKAVLATKERFVSQFTLPFSSIVAGSRRKIPLQTKRSQPLEDSYLLADVEIKPIRQ